MEYKGMPMSWVDFYEDGLQNINKQFDCKASKADVDKSIEILKTYNARVNYREIEYPPEFIFQKVLAEWNYSGSINEAINVFYEGLKLTPVIYDDTIPTLLKIKEKGYEIAVLTDLPTAMPDELFKRDIGVLIKYVDFYVSSLSCGYRKPNANGLRLISNKYNVPIEELIFVGDEEKDRMTAINAQCRFIQIGRKGNKDSSINSLNELLNYL